MQGCVPAGGFWGEPSSTCRGLPCSALLIPWHVASSSAGSLSHPPLSSQGHATFSLWSPACSLPGSVGLQHTWGSLSISRPESQLQISQAMLCEVDAQALGTLLCHKGELIDHNHKQSVLGTVCAGTEAIVVSMIKKSKTPCVQPARACTGAQSLTSNHGFHTVAKESTGEERGPTVARVSLLEASSGSTLLPSLHPALYLRVAGP